MNFWSHYISVAFYFILFVIIFNLPANFTTTKWPVIENQQWLGLCCRSACFQNAVIQQQKFTPQRWTLQNKNKSVTNPCFSVTCTQNWEFWSSVHDVEETLVASNKSTGKRHKTQERALEKALVTQATYKISIKSTVLSVTFFFFYWLMFHFHLFQALKELLLIQTQEG